MMSDGPDSHPVSGADDVSEVASDVELVVVTMAFDAKTGTGAGDRPAGVDNASLLAVLSKYTVMTRMVDGCRNVDLCSSATRPGRHLIVQKWESDAHQRAHFDSGLMVDMATSCDGILATAPEIDLWEATSAHDLR